MQKSAGQALRERMGMSVPVIQAPMAGVSTPAMAAAVSNAGGLGSLSIGAETSEGAARLMEATRLLTRGALNVNVFCHEPARRDAPLEAAWVERLRPEFVRLGAVPPPLPLAEIYTSFRTDAAKCDLLLHIKPTVVSCHFGLPTREQIDALRAAGILLLASATHLDEARAIADAGFDAVIAQGFEAGGHRGMFNPALPDDSLCAAALTRLLCKSVAIPVICAGGIMDGAGIAAALHLGAAAAQLGTAFIDCPESAADAGYRAALRGEPAKHTTMTSAISGRPARCMANRYTGIGAELPRDTIPAYPVAYHIGKALHAAAKSQQEFGYGAHWAGQGAPLARSLPAADLMAAFMGEMAAVS